MDIERGVEASLEVSPVGVRFADILVTLRPIGKELGALGVYETSYTHCYSKGVMLEMV